MPIQRCLFLLFAILSLTACKKEKKEEFKTSDTENTTEILYAKGFSIVHYEGYKLLEVYSSWDDSERKYTYALAKDQSQIPENLKVDAVIKLPVQKIIVTSTTHIPALEMLEKTETLVAFPGLQYISSPVIRNRIKEKKITEIGNNESINTELLIDLQPDVFVGFAIDGHNKAYEIIRQAGIPVIYNGDWTETSPLGKAEWIKFFGVLLDKEKEAQAWFEKITSSYLEVKQLASNATYTPTVLSGAMWQDVWYLPHGNSWGSGFIQDAGGKYLWADSEGTGSLSLSLETVLDKAQHADYWIGPAQYTTYEQMLKDNKVYRQLDAFKNKKIYSFSALKGETGGVIYYELAPSRPDLVLKDLVKILHPELLPDYELYFFRPLQ